MEGAFHKYWDDIRDTQREAVKSTEQLVALQSDLIIVIIERCIKQHAESMES